MMLEELKKSMMLDGDNEDLLLPEAESGMVTIKWRVFLDSDLISTNGIINSPLSVPLCFNDRLGRLFNMCVTLEGESSSMHV